MSDDKFIVPSGSPVVPGKFDTRIINKSLKHGTYTVDELKAHLNQLPDESEWAEYVNYNDVVEDEEISTIQDKPEGSSHSLDARSSHVPTESISDGGYGAAKSSSWGSESSASGPLYGDGGIANPQNNSDDDDDDTGGGLTH